VYEHAAAGEPPWRLLGPVRLVAGGAEVDLGPAKQRCVLAVLLMNPGWTVPTGTLIDRVWGDAPPRSATPAAPYATRLRKILLGVAATRAAGAATAPGARPTADVGRLRYTAGGYRLDCDPDLVDLHRARRLAALARSTADGAAADLYADALALWSPEPLAGIGGEWAARTRSALAAEGLDLHARRAEVDLRLGRHAAVVDRLRPRLAEHPGAEGLARMLMLALAGSGRPAEALDCYARLRAVLARELGTEPSRELADLQLRILRDEDVSVRPAPAAAHRPVPSGLPGDVPLTGRDTELTRLDGLLAGPARVIAISGTPGVGKTALAVHWAHRVAARFPDGVLYVNLRGFDPGGQPMAPAQALGSLLDALGGPAEQTPPSLDSQVARYRTLLAGRRVLVVLDNARDADQVRPLLPAAPTALAVVTSRSQLTSLVAVDGAHPVRLDVLSPRAARDLLARRLGQVTGPAVEEIVARCARLPLALTIAAARAAQTGFPLAALAAELAEAHQRLDTLDAGDPRARVRAVFSWSYTALDKPAARLFRLLGVHPGPDISAAAAASLAGLPAAQARLLLAELARACLVTEHVPGRYAFHDLLHAYAADLAGADEARAGFGRVLDHYVQTAYAAEQIVEPHSDPIRVPVPPPAGGVTAEPVAGHDAAMAWLTAEHPVLVAVQQQAAAGGYLTHTWLLAWSLSTLLDRRGHWHDQAAGWRRALAAAERLGNLPAQAYAHTFLARADAVLGQDAEADAHLHRALQLYTQDDDQVGIARTHDILANSAMRAGDLGAALRHVTRTLAMFRAAGHRRGQASALNNLGWCHALLDDHAQALAYCRQGLALFQQVGDRLGQADTWDSLGYVHLRRAEYPAAVDCYRHALALFRELGDRCKEGATLVSLGDAGHAAGDVSGACDAWRQALVILADLDHPDAEAVRAKLHGAGQPRDARLPD
jgi:DNA-binding SARP family transcriptional activator/tetratricopeptide (TPR) repeat protein